ncbi:TetR/AcrR family transcriptional regulator [Rhodococcus sp. NPDC127530]|uniref:TetR/AcrR family transcriptional regulator n=1 Tax=unclassified Rhodococcus (in: high G+C Gram-positive bacteria) TaxID=192944 RepID=UPI0036362041
MKNQLKAPGVIEQPRMAPLHRLEICLLSSGSFCQNEVSWSASPTPSREAGVAEGFIMTAELPADVPLDGTARAGSKRKALQAASQASVEYLIAQGTADVTVKDLACHAGISERTFYRYFPRKEDAVRPFLMAGIERVAAEFAARPADEPIKDSFVAVWSQSWPTTHPEEARKMYRVLAADSGFRAVWLQAIIDSEDYWCEVVASRLGLDPRSKRAMFAGAAVQTAVRVAWKSFGYDEGVSLATTIAINIHMLSDELFTPVRNDQYVARDPASL